MEPDKPQNWMGKAIIVINTPLVNELQAARMTFYN